MTPNIRDLWEDLGGGPLHASGDEFRGAAFWREGDNLNAIAINPQTNQFYDFTAGAGGGPWELTAAARGTTVPEAGRWIAEKYGLEQTEAPVYSALRAAEIKEAPAWAQGFLEYSERRLETLKQQLHESYANPAADTRTLAENIRLLTSYEARLKSLQPSGYAMVEEYRAHKAARPEWAQAMVAEGRESIQQARQVTGYVVNRMEKAERQGNGYGAA